MWWEHVDWQRVIEALVVGLFLLGRWIQTRETGETSLKLRVDQLSDQVEANDTEAQQRFSDGEKRVRDFVERTNVALGTLQVGQATQGERVNALERDMKEVRRKVFNGGVAAV